jgi:N-methylhydantoinase A
MRVGIDVGGTFTDVVGRRANGAFARLKVPTTPRAPENGALRALAELISSFGVPAEIAGDVHGIEFVAHASTIATNALLGQLHLELPRVAFITTAGFRDVVEIGRQNRSAVYDLGVKRPAPLARRDDRFVVNERREADGRVTVALDLREVDAIASEIARRGITTVAIGLLHAYVDDEHEVAIARRLAQLLPNVYLCCSAELVREFREYERFSTAVVNAALMPAVRGYLDRLAAGLRAAGVRAPLFVMRSDGGMASVEAAAARPASLIESGPAGGVIAAAFLGEALGLQRVLSFDMGGTTAKAGTILDGTPEIATEFEAAGATHSGRAQKGSGYPVRFPFVDLAEVSAGGGTIAWIDRAGSLRVGPASAGADPGPAAYGRSDKPTVTDANVVLGRLNPRALLGGAFPIDAANARRAVASIAAVTDGDVPAAAAGILAIADSEMAKVLRIVSVERGYDPRDFTLIAFGGGGPLHACAVAREIGVRRIVIPEHPGVFSANGLLTADVRVVFSRSVHAVADPSAWTTFEAVFAELQESAEGALAAQGVAGADRAHARELDMRYAGQSFELTIAGGEFAATLAAFHARHAQRYGYCVPDEKVEVVTVRAIGIGRTQKPPIHQATEGADPDPDRKGGPGRRPSNFAESTLTMAALEERPVWNGSNFEPATVFWREHLPCGTLLHGPAVVEQYDATTYVAPGWRATVDIHRNLILDDERACADT